MEQSRYKLEEEEEWGRLSWEYVIWKRKKNRLVFSILQNCKWLDFCKVFGTFSLFIQNDHKFECCLTVYFCYRSVPCSLLELCCPADDAVTQYLLAYWQSVNSNWSLWVKLNGLVNYNTKQFQQYSEFDLMTGNAKEVFEWFSDAQLAEWWKMCGSDLLQKILMFVCFCVFLLDNVLKVCFSVNVPCVLKWAAQS